MVEYINLVQSSWKSGVNFKGDTLKNLKTYTGTFMGKKTGFKTVVPPPTEAAIPESFDSRT